ncbi:MAG: DUF4258 domain-containing protein [Patescibacteria group bacterium]
MAEIILTNHVKYRLLERGISAHEVKKIAKNGQIIKIEASGIMKKAGVCSDGQRLVAVVKNYKNKIIVLTTYFKNL